MALQSPVVPDAPQADPGVCITVVNEAPPTIGVVTDPSLMVHWATTESSRFALTGLFRTQLAAIRARSQGKRLSGNAVMPHALTVEAAVAVSLIWLST